MSRKKITKKQPAKRIARERDPIPWKYCLLTLVCGLFLVVGFFGAARQHFSSIDLGIKNSKLRKQIEELEADQRRLLLTREVVLSPAEIKKSAKKMGFTEMSASNIEVLRGNQETKAKEKKAVETKAAKELSNSKTDSKTDKTQAAAAEKELKKKEKSGETKKDKPKTQPAIK